MINGKRVLAIIPARGGSKGLPGKNIKELAGKPLIAWSIELAVGLDDIDRVVVSTDDPGIAEVARQTGAEVPFIRPRVLSTDTASTQDVLIHCVSELGDDFDIVVLLQPTSPLRRRETFESCLKLCAEEDKVVISVSKSNKPIEWMFYREGSHIHSVLPSAGHPGRRQDCQIPYYIDGSIYCFPVKLLLNNTKLVDESALSVVSEACEAIDIDTIDDFNYCEYLITRETNDY